MISLTCRNHPDLRWSTKGPGHSLFFVGSAAAPNKPTIPCTQFKLLQARMAGVNPFDTSVKAPEGPVTTWKGALETFEGVKVMSSYYVFECDCPESDLVEVEDEESN